MPRVSRPPQPIESRRRRMQDATAPSDREGPVPAPTVTEMVLHRTIPQWLTVVVLINALLVVGE
jgi:hypothetical protein